MPMPVPPAPPALSGFAKALDHVGLSRAVLVLQGHQKSARVRRVIAVVLARPGVDVKHSVWRDYHVAGVTNAVSEDGCAKTSGQLQPAVIIGACLASCSCAHAGLLFGPHLFGSYYGNSHGDCGERD